MSKKQIIIYGLLAAVFAILVYIQFRTWRNFDWATFWSQTDQVNKRHIFHAIGLIYPAYVVRQLLYQYAKREIPEWQAQYIESFSQGPYFQHEGFY